MKYSPTLGIRPQNCYLCPGTRPLKPNGMKKIWDQILRYMFLKKKDPNAPHTTYVKMMHGMNRISILLFLICVVILIIRLIKYLIH
jgi:hypothetical protein